MVRPTYEENFSLPDDLLSERDRKPEPRYDTADNTSLSSLKDSGYRSLGDRGSNSTSSVSSVSAESPTMNSSFTFDTKEHIYCQPPPMSNETLSFVVPANSQQQQQQQVSPVSPVAESEFDFPPPPSDLELNAGHAKQLSEASVLSDASTLKQRKSPSLDGCDDSVSSSGRSDRSVWDDNSGHRRGGYQNKSEGERPRGLSVSASKLQSMMSSADDYMSKSYERETSRDYSGSLVYCQQAINVLSSASALKSGSNSVEQAVQAKLDSCLQQSDSLNVKIRQVERRLMGELHIDNQTKRESASSDYTPLHSAINRAPPRKPPSPLATGADGGYAHRRLSRADSNVSNGSAGSSGKAAETAGQTTGKMEQRGHHIELPPKTKPPLAQRTSAGQQYKDVALPTTLQRHGYIREGCKPPTQPVDLSQQAEAGAPVIPPPKEFCESEPASAYREHNSKHQPHYAQRNQYSQPASRAAVSVSNNNNLSVHSSNGGAGSGNFREPAVPPKQTINKQGIRDLLVQDMLKRQGQTSSANHSQAYSNSGVSRTTYTTQQPLPAAYQPQVRLYESQPPAPHGPRGAPRPDHEAPLWTPPQRSAYDRGLSHYDSPTYQNRNNRTGRVNANPPPSGYPTQPSTNSRLQSCTNAYQRTNPQAFRQGEDKYRPQHCHQYSTEL